MKTIFTYSAKFKRLLVLIFFTLTTTIYAQQIAYDCNNCSSGDVNILKVELVSTTLNPDWTLGSNVDKYLPLPSSCYSGDDVEGYLKITIDQNAGTRYGLHMEGDLYVDEINTTSFSECDDSEFIKNVLDKFYADDSPILWTCGTKLELKKIFIGWGNSSSQNACSDPCSIGPHCNKPNASVSFVVLTPLSADFAFTGSCEEGNTAQTIFFDALDAADGIGGMPPYASFSWTIVKNPLTAFSEALSGSNPSYDFSQPGAGPGTYTVTLTVTDDDPVASSTISKDITVDSCCKNLTLTPSSKIDVSCYGANTGAVTAGAVSNTVGTVSYSWKNAVNTVVGTSPTVNNLPAGTYTLTVMDNCSSLSNTATIEQPIAPLSATAIIVNNNNCVGCSVGSISLTVSGGTSPYLFSWTNITAPEMILGTSNSISNLPKGNYHVVITDDNDCSVEYTYEVWESGISITKDGEFIDANGNEIPDVGEVISYNFVIKNIGNVELKDIMVIDLKAQISGVTYTTLTVGQSLTTAYTGTHVITQSDIDEGFFSNRAIAISRDPDEKPVTADSSDPTPCDLCPTLLSCPGCTITPLLQSPSINITKDGTYVDSNQDGIVNIGDVVTYKFVITNMGNVTLTNITVTDVNATITGDPIVSLGVGVSDSTTFEGSHVITQQDIDSGLIYNFATVIAKDPKNGDVTDTSSDPTPCNSCPTNPECLDCTITELDQSPGINITKDGAYVDSNQDGIVNIGDVVTYKFVITNTGNVTLTDITVTDVNAAITGGPIVSLGVGVSDSTTFEGSHVITQQDIDSGLIYNFATVIAKDPKNGDVTGTSSDPTPCISCPINSECPDCTITELSQSPSITITKDGTYVDSNQDGITNVGDIISYNFVIKNTGNVTLTNVIVSDLNAEVVGETIPILAVGATDSTTFSGTHIITQANINAGIFYNLAIVTALDPKGNPVTATSSDPTPCELCPTLFSCPTCTITSLTPSPSLLVIKSSTTESFSVVGDIINYKITIINTGNQTLYQITVQDPLTGLNSIIDILEPGGSSEYLQSYTVTQEDLDRGSVTNIATANGFNPNEFPISATDDEIIDEKPNLIDAADDNAVTIASYHQTIPNFINVFNNDNLNGMPLNEENIILTTVEPNPFMQLNPDGSIDILPNPPAGTQTLTYQICEKLNTTNCDTAVVSITIGAPLSCSVVLDSAVSCFEKGDGKATVTAIGGNGEYTYLWDNGEITKLAEILTFGMHTVTVTDALGYKTSCNVNVTINDTVFPIISCPENITQSTDQGLCTAVVTYSVPLGTDNCTGQTTIQIAGLPSGSTFPQGTTTNIFEVTDSSGTKAICSFDVIVINTSKPIIAALPDITTASCPAEPSFAQATATDICGNSVTLTYLDEIELGDCPSDYTIIRTWTATNSNGISSTASQTINVSDNTPPTLISKIEDVDVDCNEIPPIPQLEFSDDCSGLGEIILPSTTENIIDKTAESYTIIRDWIVNDLCGNTKTYTQTIKVKIKDGLTVQAYEACNADPTEIELKELIPQEYQSLPGKWRDTDNSGGLLSEQNGTFSAFKIPLGRYLLEYVIEDAFCPRVNQVSVNVTDDCVVLGCGNLVVHDFFSPNEDGYNDFFKIENIELPCYESNSVKIFNRWGALVYETEGYDNNVNVFRGFSEANVTVDQNSELPSGTYYYLLEYTAEDKPYKKGGYLYLSR